MKYADESDWLESDEGQEIEIKMKVAKKKKWLEMKEKLICLRLI